MNPRTPRLRRLLASVVLLPSALTGVSAAQAPAEPLGRALALVPSRAAAFVVVPSLKRASDELQQCIERMDRPDAALAGRPIDQLKAALGVSVGVDDLGALAIVQLPKADAFSAVAIVPVKDSKEFLEGNFKRAADKGDDAWTNPSGTVIYAKTVESHVVLGDDAETVRGFATDEGIGATVAQRLGERGTSVMAKGDVIAWAGHSALQAQMKEADATARAQMPDGELAQRFEDERKRMTELMSGLEDGVLVVDVDPLGVGLRTFAKAKADSDLGSLLKGGTDGTSTFDRLPAQPFYAIGRVDIAGIGGIAALEQLLARVPTAPTLPAWLTSARDDVRGLQFGVYPSKLGIAAGGLLNDAYLVIETPKPDVVRESMRQAILATAGELGGVKREPTWTKDKELKGGSVADAFEVKETPVPGAAAGYGPIVSQIVFGSRGFVGFVRPVSNAVMMTFSQRVDVLERGVAVSSGAGKSLANDGTIKSYRPWLIENADIEGFLGVGQLGKLIQQVAGMVPGGNAESMPKIPTTAEPIAFAAEVDKASFETACVVPSTVLALFYDQIKAQMLGGGAAAPTAPATTSDKE
ncbi:MAG: hypothetical protein JNM94_18820 [Phycisphaerae bacterium]|nr:hypothetical protein [Phycisphaerae bacterium]